MAFAKKLDTNLIPIVSKLMSSYGWGGRIRTLEMMESESTALPLGYTPVYIVVLVGVTRLELAAS